MRTNACRTAVLAVAALLSLALGACGPSQSAPATGQIGMQVRWAPSVAQAAYPSSDLSRTQTVPSGVVTMRAIVSGAGMSSVTQDFAISQYPTGGTVNNVPAGTNRSVDLQGLNSASTEIYDGKLTGITVVTGQTTNAGTVTLTAVNSSPLSATIVTPTSNQTISVGSSLNFSASASGGTGPYLYNWYFDTTNVGGGPNQVLGQTATATFNNAGTYVVELQVFDTTTSATATATVTVTVTAAGATPTWTWVAGSSTGDVTGVYGTKGVAASGQFPGSRSGAVSWTDSGGNFWVFGGVGYDSAGAQGYLNDLWKYDGTHWTWISGSSTAGASGSYGTQGVADLANVPSARTNSVAWVDSSGNLWLFGGYGDDSAGTLGYLNDLWKYASGTNQWTWVSGSQTSGAAGVYGIKGTPAPGNIPGARGFATASVDSSGNAWLFGGQVSGNFAFLNDLWKFDGSEWTWVSGSNTAGAGSVYGTQGVAAAGNVPGSRGYAMSWFGRNGHLWVFGGQEIGGDMNDLWKFDGSNWTWVTGSKTAVAFGVYGTQGVTAASNTPGSRQQSAVWKDASGNIWIFGGFGDASPSVVAGGPLNDLWKFDGSQWTWEAGGTGYYAIAVYGSLGTPSATNDPGARYGQSFAADSSGNFWLFGGAYGSGAPTTGNDLWKLRTAP